MAELNEQAVLQRLQAAKVPGAQLGAVHGGEPAWIASIGDARAGGATVDHETVFQAASLSKPVAALGILQLVDQGHLPLDEDIVPMLGHELPAHRLVADRLENRPALTVRLLLQHRAGVIGRGTTPDKANATFLAEPAGGGSQRFRNKRGANVPTLEQSWKGFGTFRPLMLTTVPGERFAYSGAGYLMLQHLVEQVTGQNFADYFDNHVFPALGAVSSTFALHPPSNWHLASGHDESGKPIAGERELAPWSAAGGLFSTARDMVYILCTMLSDGANDHGRFMSSDMMSLMLNEGLGVFVQDRGKPGQHVRHGGDNGGFRALLLAHPGAGHGAVVLTNGKSTNATALREELGRTAIATLRNR